MFPRSHEFKGGGWVGPASHTFSSGAKSGLANDSQTPPTDQENHEQLAIAADVFS